MAGDSIGDDAHGGPEASLARLAEAADAADILGIDTADVRAALTEARQRLGFPSSVYVLALVGGTGVGKSSLLNALAGTTVSPASAHRPTTADPVAWVPRAERDELVGLLDWLEILQVREHDDPALTSVAVLDLPDLDSVAVEHRARVEQLLPKVDAVAWVVDPEKYHDAVLHDDFLRTWLPRLARQALILNKADRLSAKDLDVVVRDIERVRERVTNRGGPEQPSVTVMSSSAAGGRDGIHDVQAWLAQGVESKAIVRARVAATLADHAAALANAAGIDPAAPLAPMFAPDMRHTATEDVSAAVLRAIDLPGFERQAVAATRARARRRGSGPLGGRARRRGSGPLGVLTSSIYRLSGREASVADPDGFIARWRERGPLTPAMEALRLALAEPLRTAAPAVRQALAASVEPAKVRSSLEAAVDRAVTRRDRTVPSSRLWPILGALQTLAAGAIAFAVAWLLLWVIARPPVDSVVLPVLGSVPVPLVFLVGALLAGYVLARVLGLHAGWVGRRWAGHVRRDIAGSVEREVGERGLADLDRLEGARGTLWEAARDVIWGPTR